MKRDPGSARWRDYLLLAFCFLAFATRLFRLDAQPIWWDEAISIHLADLSLAEIVDNRAGNLHPPLYFFLLKGWVALAGDSAFSVRFLSTWSSVLPVPALYAFGRRWLGHRVGWIAAVFSVLSPLYLAYAQEARVYALLPLIYLALLGAACRVGCVSSSFRWRDVLFLAATEALALALHYTSLFAVAFVLLALVIQLRRRRTALIRLAVAQLLVALLLLPWLVAVLTHADALGARLEMSNWQDEPVTLAHFVRLIWVFQLTGQTGLIAELSAIVVTTLLAGILVLALALLMSRSDGRRTTTALLLAWLLPLALAFLVWWLRPRSHPRYVVAFTSAFLLLVAYAIDRLLQWSRIGRAVAVGLTVTLIVPFGHGLYVHHTPRFAKDDTRGVAAAIAARAEPGDLILVPPEDWSVPYYYDGPAQIDMSWAGDDPADWQRLADLTASADQVFLVDYQRATRDPRHIFPFALEAAGDLADRRELKGLFVRIYRLDGAVVAPQLEPVEARFGRLQLTGTWVEQGAPADTAVTVALRWRLEQPDALGPDPCRVGLRLRDADRWRWTSTDDWLLNDAGQPTSEWVAAQETTTYHVLPLPRGTPPLTYQLSLGVYQVVDEATRSLDLLDPSGAPQGQSLDLAHVTLGTHLGLETDPYGVADQVPVWGTPLEVGHGLTLVGASLDRDQVAPGQALFATLHWQAGTSTSPTTATLAFRQGGADLTAVAAPVGGRYPADRWEDGQVVVEHRRLVVPGEAAAGPATVHLRVGEQQVEVGQVGVAAEAHVFELPPVQHELNVRFGDVAELVGYDVAHTEVIADQPVTLTLYWRALEGATAANYTVFTHILAADGHLVGQHDGPPAEGRRPTPGWITDEIVVDRHPMAFREAYAGPAQIEVGLYDPETLDRVPTADGSGFTLLPTPLNVLAP
ncbi:MAG: glycosyltransferase family 39 protein [Anaerolineae bacterium]